MTRIATRAAGAPVASATAGRPLAAHPAALALVVAAALALRLAVAAGSGATLHVDEAQYWDWSRSLQWGYYSKPPLVALVIRASTALFGDDELGVRALAIACWPAAATVLASLTRALVAGSAGGVQARAAGTWAALVFVASPLAALLGLVATTDAPLMLCWALALRALWAATRPATAAAADRVAARRRRLGWAGFAVAAAFGLLDKYTFAALVPGALLWVAWRALTARRGEAPSRAALSTALGAALAAIAIALVPHLRWNLRAGWPTWEHTAEITLHAQNGANGVAAALGHAGLYLAAQALVAAPLLLPVLALQRWRAARRWRDRAACTAANRAAAANAEPTGGNAFLVLTHLPLAIAGLVQAAHASAELNWVAPLHLPLALVLGRFVARTADVRRAALAALAAQLVLLTVLAVVPGALRGHAGPSLLARVPDPWARMRGWDNAFARLAPALAGASDPLVIGTTRALVAQAAYQWRRHPVARAAWSDDPRTRNHYLWRCPLPLPADPGPREVFVLSEGPTPPALAAALGRVEPAASAPLERLGGPVATIVLARVVVTAASPPSSAAVPAAGRWCR